MRRLPALILASALLVPLAACGGDDGDDDDTSSASASGSASGTEDETTTTTEQDDDEEASGAGGDYCDALEGASDAGEELDDAFENGDPEAFAAGQLILEELRDQVDDDDIADDYDSLIDGLEILADAFEEAGDDPEAQLEVLSDPELAEQFEEFTAAGERVDDFNLEECGFTLDGETEDSSDFDSTVDTIGDDGEDTSLEDFADGVEDCGDGDMAACDQLWSETPSGSEAEAFAETCGGEDPDGGHFADCEESFG